MDKLKVKEDDIVYVIDYMYPMIVKINEISEMYIIGTIIKDKENIFSKGCVISFPKNDWKYYHKVEILSKLSKILYSD